eukprot:jgi/Mesvir1/28581/Mv00996-RA.1
MLEIARFSTSQPRAFSFSVEAKQNAEKRTRQNEKRRMWHKAKKTLVSTRMKKVFVALDAADQAASPDAFGPVDAAISAAYQDIDKAVSSGTLKKNTAARRKSRLALAKQKLMIKHGLYTPAPASS